MTNGRKNSIMTLIDLSEKEDIALYFANCHNHSLFSDGVYTPEHLVALAKQVGHRAIALTDHDTVRGNYFLNKAARRAGLLSLMGCEFTTVGFGKGFHLVGFDFNPEHAGMKRLLARVSNRQTVRSRLLFEWGLERGSLRPGVTWQEVLDFFPDNDYFCNNQVFDCMVAKGIYELMDYNDFFMNNFAAGKLGLNEVLEEALQDPYPDVEEVVSLIRAAGGVPVIAHPHNREKDVDDLLRIGVMGFETCHPDLTAEEFVYYDRLCEEKGLYKCGGTDHSGVLGGLMEKMPDELHMAGPERGYMTEESFMKLYRRELG